MTKEEGRTWGTPRKLNLTLVMHAPCSQLFASFKNFLGFISLRRPKESSISSTAQPLNINQMRANKKTEMFHITSVPYPSEYLVNMALFFPQCSHSRVSWQQKARRQQRVTDLENKHTIWQLHCWQLLLYRFVCITVRNQRQRHSKVSRELKARLQLRKPLWAGCASEHMSRKHSAA